MSLLSFGSFVCILVRNDWQIRSQVSPHSVLSPHAVLAPHSVLPPHSVLSKRYGGEWWPWHLAIPYQKLSLLSQYDSNAKYLLALVYVFLNKVAEVNVNLSCSLRACVVWFLLWILHRKGVNGSWLGSLPGDENQLLCRCGSWESIWTANHYPRAIGTIF